MRGLDEVESYLAGKREGFGVHVPADTDKAKPPEKEQEE